MNEPLFNRAALLIQQMRTRLTCGADLELANEVAAAVNRWRTAAGIEGDEWPMP